MELAYSRCYIQRRRWHPTPVLLPGESHRRRSLVGCSPWGCWVEQDWATSLSLFTFMRWRRKVQPTPVFSPEESRDGGAGWAAISGVAQNRTRLNRFSSSSILTIMIFQEIAWNSSLDKCFANKIVVVKILQTCCFKVKNKKSVFLLAHCDFYSNENIWKE